MFVAGVFAPHAVVAEVEAVVAPEDDDGVVGDALFVEGVEEFTDLGVGVGDAGAVAVDEFTLELFGEEAGAFGDTGVGAVFQFPGILEMDFGGAFGKGGELLDLLNLGLC